MCIVGARLCGSDELATVRYQFGTLREALSGRSNLSLGQRLELLVCYMLASIHRRSRLADA